jgi:polyisoprenoid-binding protein YceI
VKGLVLAMMMAGATVASMASPQAPATDPTEWKIDSSHSSADFSVVHLMVSTVRGHMGPVSGKIWYNGTDPSSIRVDAAIDVTRISTGSDTRDADLRGDEFFDIAHYPVITFKSTRVTPGVTGSFTMVGDLAIRGTTKAVTLKVDGPSPVLKAAGVSHVAAEATTMINRFDYGLKYSKLTEGIAVVGPDVKITVNIEATKR